MMKVKLLHGLFFYFLIFFSCAGNSDSSKTNPEQKIIVGAERISNYIQLLQDKKVGVVSNHTSYVKNTHLVDTLLSINVHIEKIFAPEHGFRGNADAGETINNLIDKKTGIEIISLYGKNYKPTKENLKDLDVMVFDIQDVGVRFFTYLSTLHYVMEACAENDILLLVFDRPNPNSFYIDGPVMEKEHTSFVGLHPVPIVYGMTIGEYAKMINGEGWLKNSIQCDLKIIPCKNYSHNIYYELPIKPSPNLPSMRSIYLYPSLALFEGTVVSAGRGTETPFEIIGHPEFKNGNYQFTPRSIPGMSKNPKFKGEACYGMDLRDISIEFLKQKAGLQLEWLILAHQSVNVDNFFNPFFYNLAGTSQLKEQIINGVKTSAIKTSWEPDINTFKTIREKYLIYP